MTKMTSRSAVFAAARRHNSERGVTLAGPDGPIDVRPLRRLGAIDHMRGPLRAAALRFLRGNCAVGFMALRDQTFTVYPCRARMSDPRPTPIPLADLLATAARCDDLDGVQRALGLTGDGLAASRAAEINRACHHAAAILAAAYGLIERDTIADIIDPD